MSNSYNVTVPDDSEPTRLDRFLATSLPDLSRSRLQDLIAQGCVTCNGKVTQDASGKTKPAQSYVITIPELIASVMAPQDIPLDIIYEDEHLLVINKQAGLTVHPGAGNHDMTLVNALLSHCGDTLSGVGGVARPGIVHRIDKDTTGLLVVAKHDTAHIHLSEQLAARTLKRTYAAVTWGEPDPANGTITGNINRSTTDRQKMTVVRTGGKPAATHYRTVRTFGHPDRDHTIATHIECRLETGRTHQIRVHMLHTNHPLVGDPVYGQSTQSRLSAGALKTLPEPMKKGILAFQRQALHAKELAFIHPVSGELMRFSCDLPPDLLGLLSILGGTS